MIINFLIKFFTFFFLVALCIWGYIVLTSKPSNLREWTIEHSANSYIEKTENNTYIVKNYRDFSLLDSNEMESAKEKKDSSFRDFRKKYYKDVEFSIDQIQGIYLITPKNEYDKNFAPFIYFDIKNKDNFGVSILPRRQEEENYSFIGSISKKYEIFYLMTSPQLIVEEQILNIAETPVLLSLPIQIDKPQTKELIEYFSSRSLELNETPEFYNYVTNNEYIEYNQAFRAVFPRKITSKSFSRTKITDILYGNKIVNKPTPVDIAKYIFTSQK